MELNMLLVKFGVFLIYFLKPAMLVKDSMELSSFTFLWEDAEARCLRQGQILAPGRRYRAKMIKKLMEKENVDAVWLNGWRAVSDIVPDADGKLSTLKVDFSRPHNKELKMICQLDSYYYDPTYRAKSTEIARTICNSDGAKLADVTTEANVKDITKDMIVDSPHWINSISSQGSKIKQCLVARKVGNDLKYNYEDCDQEFHFICVKGDDILASFSPLISLKMARFEEFEELIEKHSQSTVTSTEIFDLFSSYEIPVKSSSIETSLPPSSTIKSKMTSNVTQSEKRTSTPMIPSIQYTATSTSVVSSVNSQMSSAYVSPSTQSQVSSAEAMSSVQAAVTSADATSSIQNEYISDDVTALETIGTAISVSEFEKGTFTVTDSAQLTASKTYAIPTIDEKSSSSIIVKDTVVVLSSILPSYLTSIDVLKPSESTQDLVKTTMTMDSEEPSIDFTDIHMVSIEKSIEEIIRVTASPSQTIESSSIDKFYRENVFVEGENSSVTENLFPPISATGTLSMQISKASSSSTGYNKISEDTAMGIESDLILIKSTQSTLSTLSSESYFRSDVLDNTPVDSFDAAEVSTISVPSNGIYQTQDIIIATSSTPKVKQSKSSSFEGTNVLSESVSTLKKIYSSSTEIMSSFEITDTGTEESNSSSNIPSDFISHVTFSSVFQDVIATKSTSTYAHALGSSLIQIPRESTLMPFECTEIGSTTLCGDMLPPFNTPYTLVARKATSVIPTVLTSSMTDFMTDAPISSSRIESSLSMYPTTPLSSNLVPSLSSVVPSTFNYDDNYDILKEDNDNIISPDSEQTSKYPIDTSDGYDADRNIPGVLAEDDEFEENEVGNASADTGEVIEKKEGDKDEGTEVGLWVAFAILITLVIIALILAAFLYRKRKKQKSKDINTAAPPVSSDETVELRDSRSPSRENGKPRESATYKDPAYDI